MSEDQSLVFSDDNRKAHDDALVEFDFSERMRTAGQIANEYAQSGAFFDYNSRKSNNTLSAHRASLKRFAEFLVHVGIIDAESIDITAERLQNQSKQWRGVTHGLIIGFREWMKGEGDAIASLNARLSAVKTYAKLAFAAGVIDDHEHAMIRTVTGYSRKEAGRVNDRREVTRRGDKKADHVPIGEQQAERLKMQPNTPQGRRDALMMCLLLDHGLRVGELVALTVGDFDVEAGEMTFYRPKVDKVQTHKLTSDTHAALKAWVNFGDVPARDDQPILRASQKGGKLTRPGMTRRGITKRVRALGEEVGLRGLSAHDCRHYWATYWSKRIDRLPRGLFTLQESGGWSSLNMPRRYAEDSTTSNEGMA